MPVKVLHKYSNHLPSLSSVLTKCFINPSLYVGEEILFCLLELEDYQSHFYHQASILISKARLL